MGRIRLRRRFLTSVLSAGCRRLMSIRWLMGSMCGCRAKGRGRFLLLSCMRR
ncbi:hypothetical protein EMPG_15380 [Blastomyces silverae]|uniref:Uncharacterized protein n=1 Tax=Blastomyces silverae TaxID=2060906 RepID=A0A0H1BDI8_9EURO|nr:hypothetical protein EMPG_15380 [Blastomyces silverae]